MNCSNVFWFAIEFEETLPLRVAAPVVRLRELLWPTKGYEKGLILAPVLPGVDISIVLLMDQSFRGTYVGLFCGLRRALFVFFNFDVEDLPENPCRRAVN